MIDLYHYLVLYAMLCVNPCRRSQLDEETAPLVASNIAEFLLYEEDDERMSSLLTEL